MPVTNLIAVERETTIRTSDADDLVYIWTAQRKMINRLRKHTAFREVRSGRYGGSPWAEFTVSADRWTIGVKRTMRLTEAQRREAAARARRLTPTSSTL